MRLWVDDLRTPPDPDWIWAKSSTAAICHLEEWLDGGMPAMGLVISLDHDLGGDDTTRRIVMWLIENDTNQWVEEVFIHSSNPPGAIWLEQTCKRYEVGETVRRVTYVAPAGSQ